MLDHSNASTKVKPTKNKTLSNLPGELPDMVLKESDNNFAYLI